MKLSASEMAATVAEDTPAVRVRNVILRYGKTHALRDVSLEVAKGSLVGLIGPDGVGVTTAELFDRRGFIGASAQTLLVQRQR